MFAARTKFITIAALLFALSLPVFAQEAKFYSKGKEAFRDGLYDVAEKQFRQLLEQFPDTARREETVLLLAQCELKLGRWEEASKRLQAEIAAIKVSKKFNDDYVFWLGESLSKGRQFGEAEKRYRQVIDQTEKSSYLTQAQYGLAWALYQVKRSEEALQLFEKLAASKDKANAEIAQNAQIAMGQVYLSLNQHDKAAAIFRPIAEKTPPGKFAFEARYWLGLNAYEQKQFDDALAQFQEIVSQPKVWPQWVLGEAWSQIGWIHWNKSDYEKSAAAFEQAITSLESEKKKRESAIQYGQCYLRLGKIDTALTKMKDFVKTHAGEPLAGDVQLAIADIYLSQNKFEDAAREYGLLITSFPAHESIPTAHFYLGWALFEQKKYEESVEEFQRATASTRDASQAAEAMYKIGDAYWMAEQFQKAVTAYQALIDRYPDNPHVEEALYQIVQAQLNLKSLSQAEAALGKLLARFPESKFRDDCYLQIGLAYVKETQYNKARTLFQSFLQKFPDSPVAPKVLMELGQSYYLEGLYSEALEEFNKIALEDPPVHAEVIPVAKYRRGLCLYQLKQMKEAVQEFGELVEKYKDSPVTPEVQFRIGEFFFNQKNYTEAQRQFDLLQTRYPQSPYADAALYWAGRAAFARQGYKDAKIFFDNLLSNYPRSPWRPDARFWQGDTLIEQGGPDAYANALLVFDQLIRDFVTSDLVEEAWGRKGDCQFTLQRYQEAIISYKNVADSPKANVSQKNHARYQIGVCYEKLGRTGEAFDQYMNIIYDQVAPVPATTTVTESYWFCRAGFAAAAIKKQQDQWREAMKIYQRLIDSNVSCSQEAQEQVRLIADSKMVPVLGQ